MVLHFEKYLLYTVFTLREGFRAGDSLPIIFLGIPMHNMAFFSTIIGFYMPFFSIRAFHGFSSYGDIITLSARPNSTASRAGM